jgi:transcriptional regulator with XRE-family HTH domain
VYLRELRKRAGLSLRAAKELSGDISWTHLAKIERGDVDCIPQLYVLRGLGAAYNVPLRELAAAAGYNREEAWPSDWLERVSLHSGIKAHPRIWGPLQLEILQELLQWAAFTDPDDIQNLLSDG